MNRIMIYVAQFNTTHVAQLALPKALHNHKLKNTHDPHTDNNPFQKALHLNLKDVVLTCVKIWQIE